MAVAAGLRLAVADARPNPWWASEHVALILYPDLFDVRLNLLHVPAGLAVAQVLLLDELRVLFLVVLKLTRTLTRKLTRMLLLPLYLLVQRLIILCSEALGLQAAHRCYL